MTAKAPDPDGFCMVDQRYARKVSAGLVMGRSGKGVVATWFEGATAGHLLGQASCSMLIAFSRDDGVPRRGPNCADSMFGPTPHAIPWLCG